MSEIRRRISAFGRTLLSKSKVVCCIIVVLFSVSPLWLQAQSRPDSARIAFDRLFDLIADYVGEDEQDVDIDVEEMYDAVYDAYLHPIDWNTASKEQLDRLLFLPDIVVENLLYYADEYGPVRTMGELRMVPDITAPMLLILPNIMEVGAVIDTTVWTDAFEHISHRVSLRADIGLERRRGYSPQVGAYPGIPVRPVVKYDMRAGKNFKAALTLESDAGEPWFGPRAQGFDLYRFYAQSDNLPYVGRVVAGTYRAQFGQGLVFGSMAYGSRMSRLLDMRSTHSAPTGTSSASEVPHLFGAAISSTVRLSDKTDFDISALYGISPLDADTSGGVWHSIIMSGYHRTATERSRRHTLGLHTLGVDASVVGYHYSVGLTMYGGIFTLPAVAGQSSAYSDFAGRCQMSASAHYAVRAGAVRLAGEVAVAVNGAFAATNTIQFVPSSSLSLSINHRYISPRYHAFWINTPTATLGGDPEHGASVALRVPLARSSYLSMIADVFSPLVSTSVTSAGGVGYEVAAEYRALASRDIDIIARLRYRSRPRWYRPSGEPLAVNVREDVALASSSVRYDIVDVVDMKSALQVNLAITDPIKVVSAALPPYTWGANIYQDVAYRPRAVPLTVRARVAFCYAPEWTNRFYAYEYDVSAAGFSPAMYGVSLRWFLCAKYQLPFPLDISFRLAQTIFFDRNTVSSGYNQIDANHSTDIHLFLNYRF